MNLTGPNVNDVVAGRYRILRELGRGGMGVVYLVEHVHTGEQLAMKVLLQHVGASDETVTRFKREARAPARIKSDHVVKIVDADVAIELGGAPFMVMELLEGASLEQHLEKSGAISKEETVAILGELAMALDKAHAIGVVHRDLKPENVFLHQRDRSVVVKLLDFGISKLTDEGGGDIASAGLTKTGALMGTPLYMSPEQARGVSVDRATDVWAVGLIAFRMLAGKVYWQAETLAVLMSQILAMPMAAPSTLALLPPAFDTWFFRSCAREPSGRFRSVGEQVAALADALGLPSPLLGQSAPPGSTSLTSSRSTPYAPAQHRFADTNQGISNTASGLPPRRRWPLALAGGFAVCAIAGGVVLLLARSSSPREASLTGSIHQPSASTSSSPVTLASPPSSPPPEPSDLPPLVKAAPTAARTSKTPPTTPTASASLKPPPPEPNGTAPDPQRATPESHRAPPEPASKPATTVFSPTAL